MTQDDPRVPALGAVAILTDLQVRLVFAPQRPEARVVALPIEVNQMKVAQLGAMMQQGDVHLQVKNGFGPERKIVLSPPEVAILYDLLDKFITELPRVDNKTETKA